MVIELSTLDGLKSGYVLSLYGGRTGRIRNTIHPYNCDHIEQMRMSKPKIWADTIEELEIWIQEQGGELDPDLPRCLSCPQIPKEPTESDFEFRALHRLGVSGTAMWKLREEAPVCLKCGSKNWRLALTNTYCLDFTDTASNPDGDMLITDENQIDLRCYECNHKPTLRERAVILQSKLLRGLRIEIGKSVYERDCEYEYDEDDAN